MSRLTTCNYCNLKAMKRHKPKGARIYLRSAIGGGVDIFIVPKGEELDISVDKKGNHGKQWKAWMMEISDHCVC